MWALAVMITAVLQLAAPFDTLYTNGDFAAIAQEASWDSATDQVWVARARNTEAQFVHTSGTPFEDAISAAITAAERALELEPGNVPAALELARALGYRALTQGILQNMSVAPRIKGLLEHVVATDPANADGLVALAAMHQQLHQSGAGWLYGAKPALIEEYVQAALRAAPNRIGIKNEVAEIALRANNPAWVCELVTAATALVPTTWAEAREAERAAALAFTHGCL